MQVCAAIWDSQGALQDAGEASSAQPLTLSAPQHPGPDPGARRRSLLADPAAAAGAGAPGVQCDGRIQVHNCS